ncbi:MAG: hypothetical protein KAW84_07465, partial [Thermoplasmata archaeon]|nr:hypothetical protein [Thermoplasmata archaeon]
RFRMERKGIRVVRPGSFVVRGKAVIGEVTSCIVVEGVQHGMALIPRKYAVEDTLIGMVYPPRGAELFKKEVQKLVSSSKATVETARILPRLLIQEEAQEE